MYIYLASAAMMITITIYYGKNTLSLLCHCDMSYQCKVSANFPLLFHSCFSCGDVLVGVTGLEFAYSQSPPQLRNTVTAMWCITQALGNGL